MGPYWALFVAGFKRQSTYRLAVLTGLAANLLFGVFRTAVFDALYRQRDEVAGFDHSAAVTYIWIIQVLFFMIWTSWLWEFPERVRSGDFVVELLRPGDLFGRLMATDLGRAGCSFVTRGLIQLIGAALLLQLTLPTRAAGIAALALTFALAAVAAAEIRFLFGVTAFWTPDYRGWYNLAFSFVYLLAGFMVPIEFFPGPIRAVAEFGPSFALLAAPVRVALGHDVLMSLAVQAGWVVVMTIGARAILGAAARRMVIHGG